MLASVIYELIHRLDPTALPALPVSHNNNNNNTIDAINNGIVGTLLSTKVNNTSNTANTVGKSVATSNSSRSDNNDISSSANKEVVVVVPTGILGRLSKLLGMADTTPGFEVFRQGSVEDKLLVTPGIGIRTMWYMSLSELHGLLLPRSKLEPIRALFEEWFTTELQDPLDAWIQRLVKHVVSKQWERQQQRAAAADDSAVTYRRKSVIS